MEESEEEEAAREEEGEEEEAELEEGGQEVERTERSKMTLP